MHRTFFSKLLERRVPQIMGGYIGICWGLISFTVFLTKHYSLSKHLIDAVVLLAVTLVPSALLLAYTHGKPGRDRWGKAEKVLVPLNLLLVIGLLGFQFQGKNLGRTTEIVTAVDDGGNSIERLVAKETFRRRVGLFAWTNTTGNEDLDWLQRGLPLMLERDLRQNIFIAGRSPYDGALRSHLKRSGHGNKIGVPIALARKISEALSLDFFVTGDLDYDGTLFQARLKIYRSESANLIAEVDVKATTPQNLVDEASLGLTPHLDLQALSDKEVIDYPVAEQLTRSPVALEAFVKGIDLVNYENDYRGAANFFRKAVGEDPDFAAAYLRLGLTLTSSGEMEPARDAFTEALRRDYRLTPAETFYAKGTRYFIDQDTEKIVPLYETWTELYPQDINAHYRLAGAYQQYANQADEAIATYRRILKIDPTSTAALFELARLLRMQGKVEESLRLFRPYLESHPEDAAGQLFLGAASWSVGNLSEARQCFEKAVHLSSEDERPILNLAFLDMAEGDLVEAEERLRAAAARYPSQQAQVRLLNAQAELLSLSGRFQDAALEHRRMVALNAGRRNPIDGLVDEMFGVDREVKAGNLGGTLIRLEEIKSSLEPPLDRLASIGFMLAYSAAEDPEKTEPHLLASEKLFQEDFQRNDMLYLITEVRGHMLLQRNQIQEAVRTFAEALAQAKDSTNLRDNLTKESQMLSQLGRAQRLAGDLEGAEKNLNQAQVRSPALPTAHLDLALLYRQQNQIDLAKEHLSQTLAIWVEADSSFDLAQEARDLAVDLGVTQPASRR